jgi:hypothetical protein
MTMGRDGGRRVAMEVREEIELIVESGPTFRRKLSNLPAFNKLQQHTKRIAFKPRISQPLYWKPPKLEVNASFLCFSPYLSLENGATSSHTSIQSRDRPVL